MSHKKPIISNRKQLAKSRLFTIEGMHLEFANGVERDYELVIGAAAGSVMVVPMLDDHTVLLIREYAAGMDEYILTFPKGAVDANEDFALAANRELQEEVGYAARDIIQLGKFSSSPGYLTAVMQLFLARDLYPQRIAGDEPEEIEVVPWSLKKIDELLAQPDFYEGRAIAAVLMVERQFRGSV